MCKQVNVQELINECEEFDERGGARYYWEAKIEMFDRTDDVYTAFGIDAIPISIEEIEQLKQGKVAYFSDGEYAYIIYYKEVEECLD